MARKRTRSDDTPPDEPIVPPVPAPASSVDLDETIDPPTAEGDEGFATQDFADTPVANPEPGRSIPEGEIPYPDWMVALSDPDPEYDVAFRLRGRRDDQALHRSVASLELATTLVHLYKQLGWGGDVTVTHVADGSVVAVESAPLTDQNAPI